MEHPYFEPIRKMHKDKENKGDHVEVTSEHSSMDEEV
jgi:hypothetical protein